MLGEVSGGDPEGLANDAEVRPRHLGQHGQDPESDSLVDDLYTAIATSRQEPVFAVSAGPLAAATK